MSDWSYVPTAHEGRYDLLYRHTFAGFVALEPEHDQAVTMQSIVYGLNHPPPVEDRDIGTVSKAKVAAYVARAATCEHFDNVRVHLIGGRSLCGTCGAPFEPVGGLHGEEG